MKFIIFYENLFLITFSVYYRVKNMSMYINSKSFLTYNGDMESDGCFQQRQ